MTTGSPADIPSFARAIAVAAVEKLATNICILDLRGVVSYTDFFVVCTAANTRQTGAISDHVVHAMQDAGYKRPRRREADAEGNWMLLDYVDVVVHVFTPEAREFYRLESLWGQVPRQTVTDDGTVVDEAARPA